MVKSILPHILRQERGKMGKAEQRNRSQKMAADFIARGIWHGKRTTKPYANSGGMPVIGAVGSSKFQRLMQKHTR